MPELHDVTWYESRLKQAANELSVKVGKPTARKRLVREIFELGKERREAIADEVVTELDCFKSNIAAIVRHEIDTLKLEQVIDVKITGINIEFFPDDKDLPSIVTISTSKMGKG